MSATETAIVVGAVAVVGVLIMANLNHPQSAPDAITYEPLTVPPCPTSGRAPGGCPTCTGQCGGNCGRH